MNTDEAVSIVDRFLRDYIARQSYFREPLKKLYPNASRTPFGFQLAYASSDDTIVVTFGLDSEIGVRELPPPVQDAAKQCIDALTNEYPELKPFKFKVEYCE